MKKKAKIIIIFITILIILLIAYSSYTIIQNNNQDKQNQKLIQTIIKNEDNKENNINLNNLKTNYNNNDIVGIISIPDTKINEVIVQSTDNSYYLNHNAYNKKDIIGATFLDYRVNIKDNKKILIYGHNSATYDIPFQDLEKYYDESFYNDHQLIKIYDGENIITYQIFSVYVETSDWSYMNLDFNTEEEWVNHLQFLKNNSFYDTGIEINKEDNIIIIQTCSYAKKYQNYENKYLLVIGKKIKVN